MFEESPAVRRISHETYYNNLDRRVLEADMDTASSYSFIAQLTMSDVGENGEFQARIAQITERDTALAKAGFLLCLLEPEYGQPLIFMDVESSNGIITPARPDIHPAHRIVDRRRGHTLGKVSQGYLLDGPAELSPREAGEVSNLYDHATPSEYTDTRTKAFESVGIFLGQD